MPDQTIPPPSADAGNSAKRSSPSNTRRTVSAALLAGGLAVCGGAIFQPPEQSPTVQLTAGTSGSSSGGASSSSGASGSSSGASGSSSGASGSSSGASSSSSGGGIGGFLRSLVSRSVAFVGGLISTFLGLLGLGSRRRAGWFF